MLKKLDKENNWDDDREAWQDKFIKISICFSVVVGVIAVSEAFAIASMMPLKQIDPIYIRVDNVTGIVDTYQEPELQKLTENEAVIQSSIQNYIERRERYNYYSLKEDRDAVIFMSEVKEAERYSNYINPDNPLSPVNIYGPNALVKIKFKNAPMVITKDKVGIYLARFIKQVDYSDNKPPEITHHAVQITFRFLGSPSTIEQIKISPLGFICISYVDTIESVNQGIKK